jgi:hypothetical protein
MLAGESTVSLQGPTCILTLSCFCKCVFELLSVIEIMVPMPFENTFKMLGEGRRLGNFVEEGQWRAVGSVYNAHTPDDLMIDV